jgi:sugar phosphate isomerase/epimerase
MKMTRNEFLKSMAAASVAMSGLSAAASLSAACTQPAKNKLKLGVSVYSYSRNLRTDNATVESVMADIADMGAEYVEILAGQDVVGYPNPTDEWVDQFNSWFDKYNLKKSAYDLYAWQEFYKDRYSTVEEVLDLLRTDLKLANRLGFPWIRMFTANFPEDAPSDIQKDDFQLKKFLRDKVDLWPNTKKWLSSAVDIAEEYDTKLAVELHAPLTLDSPYVAKIIDLIEEKKTKHLGFNLDFSCFMWKPARATMDDLLKRGAKQEILDYIIQAYRDRLGADKTVEEVKKMGGGQVEQDFASDAGIYDQSFSDPKEIKTIAPYLIYSHAKFYDITEELTEYSMPYEEILKEFKNNNIEGVLSSECENRNQELEVGTAIRMQQAMMRNILGMGHKV